MNKPSPYQFWDDRRGKLSSSKGGWKAGVDVWSHGYSIMNELVGNISYMQMVILNATGRLVEKKLADWFEACFICLSWPDSRIWCNHVGALMGNTRSSVVAGTVAGALASESRMYGGNYTSLAGVKFITDALRLINEGLTIEDIINRCAFKNDRPLVVGYVRPVNGNDERIQPMKKLTARLGFHEGPHMKLANQISEYLYEKYGEGMNILGFIAAFAADNDIAAEELYYIRPVIVASGVTACYLDTLSKQPDSYLPIRCDDIDYIGQNDRSIDF